MAVDSPTVFPHHSVPSMWLGLLQDLMSSCTECRQPGRPTSIYRTPQKNQAFVLSPILNPRCWVFAHLPQVCPNITKTGLYFCESTSISLLLFLLLLPLHHAFCYYIIFRIKARSHSCGSVHIITPLKINQ